MEQSFNENRNDQIRCHYCGELISVYARKCRYCHENLMPQSFQTEENRIPIAQRYQTNMRTVPETTPVYPTPPRTRTSYILLGVFLGCFGAHNFYAGYTGRAIAQLLIFVLLFWLIIPWIAVFIWVLVEVCSVDTDVYGRKML